MSTNNNEAPQTPSTPHIGDINPDGSTTTDITAEVMADAYNLGLTSPPLSASFSIDSPNEDSDGEEIDENAPLEVDYGSDNSDLSTSDDQGHENDLPSASDLMGTNNSSTEDDQGSGEHLTLAAKTNQIMSSYKDYIAEIQSDTTPTSIPNKDKSKDLEDIEKGRNVLGGSGIAGMLGLGGGGISSYGNNRGMNELENEFSNMAPSGRSSRFGSNSIGSGDTSKTSNLHNVTLYNDFPGDYNNNNNNDASTASNFEDFYGDLGYHPKRSYWTKKLCFKNKLMKSIIGGLLMIILFIVVPIVTTNNKDKGEGVDELALGNVSQDSVTEEGGDKWWENTDLSSESSYQDMHNNNNRPLNTDDGYDIIEYTIKQYNPTWFGRNTGWKGSTHLEAMTFCGTGKTHKESPEPKDGEFSGGYELCPYIAVCPLGPKSYPIEYSNIKEEEGPAQWIPLIDESNLWTSVHPSVGISDSCEKHIDDGHLITARPHTRVTQHVVCCQSPKMQELAHEMAAEKEIMKEEKEEAEEEKEEVWAGVYLNDTQEYAPVEYTRGKGWEGQTYVEAVNFCVLSNYDVPYQLCSYDAVCPLGKKSQPLGGYKPGGMLLHSADGAMDTNSDTGAWLPISDKFNDWLQLAHGSTDNVDGPSPSCVRYTETNNNAVPSWGVNGEGNEELTRHVLCCKVIDDKDMDKWIQLKKDLEEQKGIEEMEEEAKEAAIKAQEYGKEQGELAEKEAEEAAEEHKVMIWSKVYENALVKYKPVLYNRSKGWKGQTYSEAVEFCRESNPDVPYKVCSHNAVCPLGHNMEPLGGYKKGGDTGAWAPVSDVENDWVQLQHDGPSPTCVRYSTSHQDTLPDWGISGDDNEDLTRHVLCCKVLKEDEEHAVATQEVDPEYALTAQKYNPVWFSRNSGWNGKTYLQALSFCASSRNMIICPYSAICPEGERTRPYGGFKGGPDEELWAPIMDTLNGWVQIGATSDACLVHDSPHTAPEWGLTGASDNKGDVAPYLMCCELTDDAVEEGIHDPSTAISIAEDIDVQTSPAYTVTKEKFNPIAYNRTNGYKGNTYSDAFEFCKSTKHDDEDQILCPFQAVCPMGPRLPPYNGVIPQTAMWTPLFNQYNMWLDIGAANPCMFYNTLNGEYPEWGIKQKVVGLGLDDEKITGTIMCCKAEKVLEYHMENAMEIEEEEEEANVVTQDMLSDLNPTWFHRDTDDWEGKTWPEAVEYCAKDEGLALCPYEAICPRGMKKPPSGGVMYNDEPNGSFAPISNGFNKWVSVSGDNTCMQWETIEGSPPSWGAEDGQEDLTRHVVCCNVEDGGSYQPATPQSNVKEEGGLLDDNSDVHESQWFSRNDGWLGTTYSESVDFCAANNGMAVCHTSAICPDGNDSIPPGGPFDEGDDMWAPVSDTYNEYVKIDSTTSCILWSRMNPNPPSWGTEGGNEPMTRHIKCCKPVGDEAALQTTTVATTPVTTTTTTTTLKPTPLPSANPTLPPSSKPTPQPSYKQQIQPSAESYLITQTFQQVQNRFLSQWYDRSSGWEGSSYFEALTFCASKGSYVPCPYEAICPLGPGQHVVGGVKGTTSSYAPIIDVPNGWVSVGPDETCMPYNSYNPVPPKWGITGEGSEEVTRQIMCCREPEDGFGIQLIDESHVAVDVDTISTDRSELEQSIMDHYHPVWYTRKHGYKGTSIEEAETFCENVAGKKLCPLAAYCPNGSLSGGDSSSDVLYLDRPSFPGEQWAPISGMARGDQSPGWVSIGTVGGLTTSTCGTYNSLTLSSPMWNGSDLQSDHKQNVLCCEDPTKDDQGDSLESMMKEIYRPTWYDKLDGWNGGSWDDANSFCNFQGGRELCSYTAYCPEGNGKSVMGGHSADFKGEQWAATSDRDGWVMIGQKYHNPSTTCMTFNELEGGAPPTNFADRLAKWHQTVLSRLANAEINYEIDSEVYNRILYFLRRQRIESKATPFKRVPCQRPKIDPNIRIRSLPNNNKKKKCSIRRRWCKLLFYPSDIELFQPLLDEYALTLDPTERKDLANQLVDIVCIRKGLDSTNDEIRSQIKYQFFSCRREDNVVINVASSSSDFDERARILADAKALKESAMNYYHPECGVKASGYQARNYFDRYSAPDRADPPMYVQVKTISRTDVATIKVNSDDTGREIKAKIGQGGYDVLPSSQIVVVSGKVLDDKTTIGSRGSPKVIYVTQPLRASGDTGKKKSKKRRPTGPPPSLNRPAPRPAQRQRPPPSLNRPAPRTAPRAPPRPPPSLNGQPRRLRRVSDEDEMSSHEEQVSAATLPQHIQNEILETNTAAAEFDDVDEVLESISSDGNNLYIIELGPNAKELNIMGGTSRYVRERIDCIYKIGRTDNEGMMRLSSLNVGNFFNLRIKKYKTDNATVMEQFWHNEFELHNIRGEWFSLPDHLKAKFMSEMAMHEASGCKTFRGTSIDEFNKDPNSHISPEVDRQQWKDEWEKQKSSDFKSIQSPPSTKYNEAAFFSPHLSFNDLISNCHSRIGVISLYDKARGRTLKLKGKQCFYLVKVVIPPGEKLTPRDRWLLSRVKFGCSDDIMKRFANIQVGCQFDLEMVYFECSDNYVGMEACWKDIFDLQNCRGEWFNVLALDVKLIFDKTLSYIHSSSDLSWQDAGDLNLDELPNNDVARLMGAQVNSISGKDQDRKIDKLTSAISTLSVDAACVLEHGLDGRVMTLSKRINSDMVVDSVTGSNTECKVDGQYLPGGTGILAMARLAPYITDRSVDHLGRWSSCKLDAGKGEVTRFVSVYALSERGGAGNSIEQQHRQYIADKSIGNVTPRQLFESDFIKQLKKWMADDEQLIVCMDANEDVVDGDLSKKLSQLGLVEVSHDRLGTDSINTHGHGTRQIDGVWMSKSLSSGLQGVALLPLSKSIGDHRTFIFDISLLSLLGIDTLTTKRERRKSPSIDTDSKSSNTPPTFLGCEGNITKSNRHSFTSTYPDEKRRGWLLNWDEQTNAVLLLDDCEHPTFANIVSRQTATYRTGSLQEDELYLLLEGIRLHSSTKWKSIFSDINLGIHRLRSDSQHFDIKAREYLQRVGIWDEMKSADNGAKLLFRRLGYDCELCNVPKYWWLTLSNEFMLNRVRERNHSSDRHM